MSVRSLFYSLMAVLLLPAVDACAQGTRPTVFRGVRVFDGTTVMASTDVVISDGRITAMGRGVQAPAGALVIDGAGKTLLPGLIDSHTHVYGDALREAVMFGVTTELDMFSAVATTRTLRAEQAAGRATDRADIVSAGTLVTAPGGHGTEYGVPIPTITTPDSAQAFVDARLAEGSDYIKLVYDDGALFGLRWPTISRATMAAVIEATHRRGKLAVVHISTSKAAREAIESGADGLVHLFTDSTATADFARLAAQRGAFVIPTLVVLRSITGKPGAGPLLDDARLQPFVSPMTRSMLSASFPSRGSNGEQRYGYARETVRQLKSAGVPILVGTDAPNPGTAHGIAMHQELQLLVDAGLAPVEALAAATRVPAARFKLSDRGTIAVGQRADLLLVNGDPTTDITATRAIEGVWKQGARIDRAAFADAITQQIASAGKAPAGLAAGLVSDFESGTAAVFGTPFTPSDDSYAGGKSKVTMEIVDGGANGSSKSLRMTGTVDGGLPYAWAGSMWSPGSQMMQPADLSSKKEVSFWVKGDGGTYRMFLFYQSGGTVPQSQTIVAGTEWREVVIPWSAFNTNGKDVMALVFAAGPTAGAFNFQIDDVRLR